VLEGHKKFKSGMSNSPKRN